MPQKTPEKKLFSQFSTLFLIILSVAFSYYIIKYSIDSNSLIKNDLLLVHLRWKYILSMLIKSLLYSLDIFFYLTLIITVNFMGRQAKLKEKFSGINYKNYTKFFSVVIIVFFISLAISYEVIIPYLSRNIETYFKTTELSYKYLSEAQKYQKLGIENQASNPSKAGEYYKISLMYYQKYLYFEPNNQIVIDIINDLNLKQHTGTSNNTAQSKKSDAVSPDDIKGLFNKGVYYYNKKEYILAAYYFEKYQFFIKNDAEAKRLYQSSMEMIEKNKTAPNAKYKEILEMKSKGIIAMQEKQYIEAYDIFTYLVKKYPEEKSLKPYLGEARNLYNSLDFFVQDAASFINYPGMFNILLKAKDEKNNTYLFHVEKIIENYNDIFLYNITLFSLKSKTVKTYAYGKKINDYIIFKNSTKDTIIFKYNIKYSYIQTFLSFESKSNFSILFYPIMRQFMQTSGYPLSNIDHLFSTRVLQYFLFLVFAIFCFTYSYANRLLKIDETYNILDLFLFIIIIILLTYFFNPLLKLLIERTIMLSELLIPFPYSLIFVSLMSIFFAFIIFRLSESRFSD